MFLTVEQNNSGGYYIEDTKYGIGRYIIIEADNIIEDKRRLEDIADNYDESQNKHLFYEYCECCGNRWNAWYKDDTDLFEVPSIDNIPINDIKRYRSGYIHYKSGEIQYFQSRDSE